MLRLESDSLLSDFERVRPRLAEAYSEGMGRPAIDSVRMLKILFLRFRHKLSDRQVIERTRTDLFAEDFFRCLG